MTKLSVHSEAQPVVVDIISTKCVNANLKAY